MLSDGNDALIDVDDSAIALHVPDVLSCGILPLQQRVHRVVKRGHRPQFAVAYVELRPKVATHHETGNLEAHLILEHSLQISNLEWILSVEQQLLDSFTSSLMQLDMPALRLVSWKLLLWIGNNPCLEPLKLLVRDSQTLRDLLHRQLAFIAQVHDLSNQLLSFLGRSHLRLRRLVLLVKRSQLLFLIIVNLVFSYQP